MECAYADHLRNVALVSISRELRALSKRRSSAISAGEQRARDMQGLVILRKKSDEDRKALRDHVANCQRCQKSERTPRPGSEDLALSAEVPIADEPVG